MFILYVLTGQLVESTEKNLTSLFFEEKAGFSWNFACRARLLMGAAGVVGPAGNCYAIGITGTVTN